MNLFIASTLGQLYHVHNLIINYGYKNNFLLIVSYNDQYSQNARNIMKHHLREELFAGTDELLINNFSIFTVEKEMKRLKKFYKLFMSSHKWDKLFVSNYDSHYQLAINLALLAGIPIVVYEEGIWSYRYMLQQSMDIHKTNSLKELIKKIYMQLFTSKETREYRYGCVRSFSEGYLVFPNLIREYLDINIYHDYKPAYILKEELKSELLHNKILKDITTNSAIFLSQDYKGIITDEEFTDTVLSYLDKTSKAYDIVFIKFHPRDTQKRKELFGNAVAAGNRNIRLLDFKTEIPFEAILEFKKPKAVISIASSSLIYIPEIADDILSISIINKFKKNPTFEKYKKMLILFGNVHFA